MQTFEEKLSELVKALQRCETLTQHVKEKGEYDSNIMGTVWSVWDIAMKYHNEITDQQLTEFLKLQEKQEIFDDLIKQAEKEKRKNKLRLVKK